MLDSKINWQFKFSEPGLLINLALCQIGIFFVLKGETFLLAKKRWLFTGDLDQAGEMKILQKYPNLKVDYFKLGHHGSRTSSKKAFLQAIKPSLAFISAGRNNRFGHPHQETLNTLKELGIPWVSTQDYGMISWYYDLFGTTKFETKLSR